MMFNTITTTTSLFVRALWTVSLLWWLSSPKSMVVAFNLHNHQYASWLSSPTTHSAQQQHPKLPRRQPLQPQYLFLPNMALMATTLQPPKSRGFWLEKIHVHTNHNNNKDRDVDEMNPSLVGGHHHHHQHHHSIVPIDDDHGAQTVTDDTKTPSYYFHYTWWVPVLMALTGWLLAAQVASAATTTTTILTAAVDVEGWEIVTPTVMTERRVGSPMVTWPTNSASIMDSSTTLTAALGFGGSVDVVDFSMPSYEEGTADTKKVAPSFNPFGDFTPEIVSGGDNLKAAREEKAAADAAKAEEQAAAKAEADARRAEDRASQEARRAEERAAAQAAKAEKAAADAEKRAEKQAQLAEQREKQRASVERQKENSDTSSSQDEATPAAVEATAGSFFEIPDLKIPGFKVPDLPDMSALKIPDFKAPDMPEFKMPESSSFAMPKLDMPKFEMPAMPSSAGGELNLEMPKFEAPKMSLPSISLPNPFGGSSGGSDGDTGDNVLAPQAVRDEAAREARTAFLAADADAKEAEAAARLVRQAANDQKKVAAALKDEACATRPGGKLLCLRNPFTAGF